jgi:hypothetical protein
MDIIYNKSYIYKNYKHFLQHRIACSWASTASTEESIPGAWSGSRKLGPSRHWDRFYKTSFRAEYFSDKFLSSSFGQKHKKQHILIYLDILDNNHGFEGILKPFMVIITQIKYDQIRLHP